MENYIVDYLPEILLSISVILLLVLTRKQSEALSEVQSNALMWKEEADYLLKENLKLTMRIREINLINYSEKALYLYRTIRDHRLLKNYTFTFPFLMSIIKMGKGYERTARRHLNKLVSMGILSKDKAKRIGVEHRYILIK